jgi:hypothetical protein
MSRVTSWYAGTFAKSGALLSLQACDGRWDAERVAGALQEVAGPGVIARPVWVHGDAISFNERPVPPPVRRRSLISKVTMAKMKECLEVLRELVETRRMKERLRELTASKYPMSPEQYEEYVRLKSAEYATRSTKAWERAALIIDREDGVEPSDCADRTNDR